MKIEVTYTVREKAQTSSWDGKSVNDSITLLLDNQKGGPLPHWGSVPWKLKFHGSSVKDVNLNDKFKMTIENEGE